jgi:ribosomal-protein-alanine N-acetyltransferase
MATAKAGQEDPVFEPMKDTDLAEVLAIERIAFASPWTRQSFLFDLHDNPFARSIVARPAPGGAVIGYGCTWLVHEELRINNIAVHPDWRGRAIGRAMLRRMLAEGREAGCRIALLEVRPSNAAARSLYESEGFVQIGRRKNYYRAEREDALILALEMEGPPS